MRQMLLVLVLLAGCGTKDAGSAGDRSSDLPSSADSPTEASSSASGQSPTPRQSGPGTEIITARSEYGPMLFDASGQPIYLFTAETGARPGCYEQCAEAWPPVLTNGRPSASGDVHQGLLGTTRRTDGSTQVTYAGHPLYFYAHEDKYQVLCHDVDEFGGTWLVVRPDGTAAPG